MGSIPNLLNFGVSNILYSRVLALLHHSIRVLGEKIIADTIGQIGSAYFRIALGK